MTITTDKASFLIPLSRHLQPFSDLRAILGALGYILLFIAVIHTVYCIYRCLDIRRRIDTAGLSQPQPIATQPAALHFSRNPSAPPPEGDAQQQQPGAEVSETTDTGGCITETDRPVVRVNANIRPASRT